MVPVPSEMGQNLGVAIRNRAILGYSGPCQKHNVNYEKYPSCICSNQIRQVANKSPFYKVRIELHVFTELKRC